MPVRLTLRAAAGEPLVLRAEDGGRLLRRIARRRAGTGAHPAPADAEACAERLRKTGGTPFFAQSVICSVDPGLSLPASVLNSLRRDVLDQLLHQREDRAPIPFAEMPFFAAPHRSAGTPALRARFPSWDLPENQSGARSAMFPWDTPPQRLRELREAGFPVGIELPRGLFGLEELAASRLREAAAAGVRDCWTGNLGAARLARECGVHGARRLFRSTPRTPPRSSCCGSSALPTRS